MLDYVSRLHFLMTSNIHAQPPYRLKIIWRTSFYIASSFGAVESRSHFRISSKLSLYTSLHASIAAHRSVLSEREEELKNARENLIREGGNVIGGSSAVGLRVPGGDADELVKDG